MVPLPSQREAALCSPEAGISMALQGLNHHVKTVLICFRRKKRKKSSIIRISEVSSWALQEAEVWTELKKHRSEVGPRRATPVYTSWASDLDSLLALRVILEIILSICLYCRPPATSSSALDLDSFKQLSLFSSRFCSAWGPWASREAAVSIPKAQLSHVRPSCSSTFLWDAHGAAVPVAGGILSYTTTGSVPLLFLWH